MRTALEVGCVYVVGIDKICVVGRNSFFGAELVPYAVCRCIYTITKIITYVCTNLDR